MGMVVEGKSKLAVVTPVIQAAAYASGDQLGVLFEIPNAMDDSSGTGAVLSLTIIDKAKQKSALDLLIFSAKPTVASSDNAALDISDAEMADKFVGRVALEAADYTDLANCSIASLTQVGLLLKATKDQNNLGGESLWAILQCKGTPTYTSTSDLVIKLGVIQD